MNILEAFIKKYGQIIILILGLPCTNKSEIAKELSLDLNLPTININDYLIKDKFVEVEVKDTKFKIFENSENYNWDKLNSDVKKLKSEGVILYGNYFDKDKIDFHIDFSFFYSMNTTLCKKILIEKKLLEYDESDEKIKIYFEEIFNPNYEKLKKKHSMNKFYNVKEDTKFDESYDGLFDLLMKLINSKLKN
jgi:uridine kinase